MGDDVIPWKKVNNDWYDRAKPQNKIRLCGFYLLYSFFKFE